MLFYVLKVDVSSEKALFFIKINKKAGCLEWSDQFLFGVFGVLLYSSRLTLADLAAKYGWHISWLRT